MNITVNHETQTIAEAISLEKLLQDLKVSNEGIAVAINNQIITKSLWNTTQVIENDTITIIQATQGG